MNHYPHHIGDFNNATRHLTRVERALYRDLIELYYDTEQPIPADDFDWLARKVLARTEEELSALKYVLGEFFEKKDSVYFHSRCEEEIEKFLSKVEAKSRAGKASAAARKTKRRRNSSEKPIDCEQNPTPVEHVMDACSTTQYPIPNTQYPEKTHTPRASDEEKTEEEKLSSVGDFVLLFAEHGFSQSSATSKSVLEMLKQWRTENYTPEEIRAGIETANAVLKAEHGKERPDSPAFYAKFVKFEHDQNQDPEGIHTAAAKRVLEFLAGKTGKNFEPVPELLRPITALMAKGNTEGDCKKVIAIKYREWSERPDMLVHMKPSTLFNPDRFYEYKAQILTDAQLQEAQA